MLADISSRAVVFVLIGLGVAVAVAVGLWLRPAWRRDARVRMFVTATLLSLVPVCSAPSSGRSAAPTPPRASA